MVQQILERQEKGRQLEIGRVRELSEGEIQRRALKKQLESYGISWRRTVAFRGATLLRPPHDHSDAPIIPTRTIR